jgi:RND superfamily putative drug exporter
MLAFLSPSTLARRSARHPWLTVGLWVALIAAAVLSAGNLKTDSSQRVYGTDSERAHALLQDLRGEDAVTETIVVQSVVGSTVDSQDFSSYVANLETRVRALRGTVESVSSYYDERDESLVSKDRRTTILPVVLTGSKTDAPETVAPLLKVLDESQANGFHAQTVGDGSINRELQETAESDLLRGEGIGLPAALVILLFVFGAAVAAGVPVVLGLGGIVVSAGVTAAISQVFGINSFTINMITMIGLAVGIDYTLFIVERFREERAANVDKVEAIVMAGDTASRAVLFSGMTVVIALAGMFIVPSNVFRGMAIGAITVVIAAVAIALTLLPAVLSLLGDKVNALHLPGRGTRASHDSETGFFGRTTALVLRHPVISIVASVSLLLAAGAPFLTINLGNAGISQMPSNLDSVQAFKVLDREFSAGRIAPAEVVIKGDVKSQQVQDAVAALKARVAQDGAFASSTDLEVSGAGDIATFNILVNGDPTEQTARDSVQRLRNDYIPASFRGSGAEVVVGGTTAENNDYIDTMNSYLPIVIAFVLTLSFVLLLMVFRSIVIPLKAIVMNLLSVGAAYGLIVLVFQHGVGADLLGFQQSDQIAAFLPIFLFAVLFGLSMDYHVFLLSRIQERFVKTHDNRGSVSYGLRSTAHIITGAAAIMMAVFSGFALGDMVELQQTGFGLAVAVFLDATIVRSVLVPASMEMLGEWNWYLPSWLRWLPRINVEGGQTAQSPAYQPYAPEYVGAGE